MIKLAHCTFCDMIHGAAEVSICHEDSRAIAFMDVQPVNNGHVLVVPREHYESINDIPRDLALHLYKLTLDLAPAIRRVAGADDLNVVVNSGEAAGQDEPHYHVHIIPRRQGDGFDIPLPFGRSSTRTPPGSSPLCAIPSRQPRWIALLRFRCSRSQPL
jgi:histidine triad (HIT) family protein